MIVRNIIEFFIGLLPVVELPSGIVGGLSSAGQFIGVCNYYIPFGTFLICAGIYFVHWLACAALSSVLKLL